MNAVVALGVVVLSESKIGQEEQHIQDGTARLRRLTRRNPCRDGVHFLVEKRGPAHFSSEVL